MASIKRKGFFGDSYTQHTDRWGRPTGTSRTTNNFLGGKTTHTKHNSGAVVVSRHYGNRTYTKKFK